MKIVQYITWLASENGAYDTRGGGEGGVLPYKRLMGMNRWMGSHFYDWIDYNGVAFTIESDKTGIAKITY